MSRVCVFQDWIFDLTMQQQSVLVLGCRGPDGIAKFHLTKLIVARYRATVLKAAYLGRAMRIDEGDATTFMTLDKFSMDGQWDVLCQSFFSHVDELPHHYYMHLMHGAEIAGYKHPDLLFRKRWNGFYLDCCHDLHLHPEWEADMDNRLSDWHRKHWDAPTIASEKECGKAVGEWRDIASAPRDGTNVLLTGDRWTAVGAYWPCNSHWTETMASGMKLNSPTHWQPLPALPAASLIAKGEGK